MKDDNMAEQNYDGPERRTNVSQRECDLRHGEVNTFMKDTKTTQETLFKKLDHYQILLITTLIAVIVQLVLKLIGK